MALADKPQIAAANKIDALDDPARLDALRRSISTRPACRSTRSPAVTGEGLPALLEAMWREVARSVLPAAV